MKATMLVVAFLYAATAGAEARGMMIALTRRLSAAFPRCCFGSGRWLPEKLGS